MYFGDAKREGELRYKKKQITKNGVCILEHRCVTDIIHAESFLLGRGFKQNLELPFTATTCLRLLCADISLQTEYRRREINLRVGFQILSALNITRQLLSYLCSTVSLPGPLTEAGH